MPGPLQAAGALTAPSKYAPLHVNRFFTGLWTQRNPLREAAVAQIYEKFYSGARFDSLIGGLNAEISARLTPIKRPGFSIYNTQTFPPIYRYYSFKNQDGLGVPQIRLMADTLADVYDATGPATKQSIYTKGAGDGTSFFQSILNTLYFGTGGSPTTSVPGGNGAGHALKYATAPTVWNAATTLALGYWLIDANFNIQQVTTAGITGGVLPAFNVAVRGVTADNTVVWTNRGPAVNNWGVSGPSAAPTIQATTDQMWKPLGGYNALQSAIIDSNGNVQMCFNNVATGAEQPIWAVNQGEYTNDNGTTAAWICCGKAAAWLPNHDYAYVSAVIDSNGNLQVATAIVNPGTSGAVTPVWNVVLGGNTVDNLVTWTNCGKGKVIVFRGYQWVFAYHTVTGEVSQASPILAIPGAMGDAFSATIRCQGVAEAQIDKIYLFRTSDGGATFLKTGEGANTGIGNVDIVDTTLDKNLNALIQADIVGDNARPLDGLINLAFHRGRVWGSVGTTTYYSRASSAVAGSPYSCFPGGNYFVWPDVVIRHWPTIIGLIVLTTANMYIVRGRGTEADPFIADEYLGGIGLSNFDAFGFHGSTAYLMQPDKKLISLDPGAGVEEVGFPIGDQLAAFSPSSGFGVDVTWHESGSGESALFVTDGFTQRGWFRMSATAAPETGLLWSPLGQLAGSPTPQFSRTKSMEVTPGQRRLLVGPPPGGGKILMRDPNVAQDNLVDFAWYIDIGSITLAQPGQIAELEFVTLDSLRIGTRPTIGIRLDEISGAFETLKWTCFDPPKLPASASLFNDRYIMQQSQQHTYCRHAQFRIQWVAENLRNELLSYTIFGAIHQEKRGG